MNLHKNRDDLENLDEYLSDLINKTQMSYHEAASDFQKSYMSYVKEGNWPPNNIKSSFSLFDLYVSPKLKENSVKVAYFMIDGLRYELGVELKNQLQKGLATPIAVFTFIDTVNNPLKGWGRCFQNRERICPFRLKTKN